VLSLIAQKQRLFTLLYLLILICTLIVGYHEFRSYPDYWQIRLHVPASYLYLTALLGLFLYRVAVFNKLARVKVMLSDVAAGTAAALVLLAGYMCAMEAITDYNYAFTKYHILSDELLWFSIIFAGLVTISLPVAYLRLRARELLFILPLFLYAPMLYVCLEYPKVFTELNAEDKLIEYSTAIFFLIGSLGIFWLVNRTGPRWLRMVILFGGLFIFCIAGEEVSWGQRLLNIKTPEYIARNNTQHELTIHNLHPVYSRIVPTYIFFGFVIGVIVPMLKKLLSWQPRWRQLSWRAWLPGFTTALFFTQLTIQRYFTREFGIKEMKINHWDLVIWNEFAEAVAALGVLIYVAFRIIEVRKFSK